MGNRLRKYVIVMAVVSVLVAAVFAIITYERHLYRVLHVYADEARNIYFLEGNGTRTILFKTDTEGNVIFRKTLPSRVSGLNAYYDGLVADGSDNIFLRVMLENKDGALVSEYIEVYSPGGRALKKIYNIEYDDFLVRDNNRLVSMQSINGVVVFFDILQPKETPTMGLDMVTVTGNFETTVTSIRYTLPFTPDEAIWADGKIYYTDRKSQLFEVGHDGAQQRVEFGDGQEPVIVYYLSADSGGGLYLTDTHSFSFLKYTASTGMTDVLFNRGDRLSNATDLLFGSVQDMSYYNGKFVGISPAYMDNGYIYILERDDGQVFQIDRLRNNMPYMLLTTVAVLIASLAVQIIAALAVMAILTIRSLMFRIIGQLIPFVLISMLLVSAVLNEMLQSSMQQEIFTNIYLLAKNLVRLIDGDEFEQIKLPMDSNDPYVAGLNERIDLSVGDLTYENMNFDEKTFYYALYTVRNRDIFIAFGEGMQSYMNADYLAPEEDFQAVLDAAGEKDYYVSISRDVYGYWLNCFTFIRNSEGTVVGLFEFGVDFKVVSMSVQNIVYRAVMIVAVFTLCIIAGIWFTATKVLRNLKALKTGASEMSHGNWFVKVDIKGNDEIRDVGNAFNLMSSRIEQYLENMTKLNTAYERFVPKKLFALLGSDNVLDIGLDDRQTKDLSLMYINIINFYSLINGMTDAQNLAFFNKVFDIISKVIDEKNGMIETFDGSRTKVVYQNTFNAFESALRILDEIQIYNQSAEDDGKPLQVDLGISIQQGDIVVGVVGNENRITISTVSEAVSNAVFMDDLCEQLKAKLLVTREALDKLDGTQNYRRRYIGRFEAYHGKMLELYDMLDAYPAEERTRKLATRDVFVKGVELYGEGKYTEARKYFINVMRSDISDEIARYYLFECEKLENK